ncbi:hypothetical protein LQ327_07935 [Actinomycetospora endophytica]|uniref:Uncharacterized protein n=1 Tax=Actinomycetospora endophytica TaxID=2291215 RepID=A0ABS8P4Y6_9PSEU|nr:hypothetical protein [Actinomycetospora endophytica]MCD2193315.1 hypothetical protein [Actinomycetospora endophytica]
MDTPAPPRVGRVPGVAAEIGVAYVLVLGASPACVLLPVRISPPGP